MMPDPMDCLADVMGDGHLNHQTAAEVGYYETWHPSGHTLRLAKSLDRSPPSSFRLQRLDWLNPGTLPYMHGGRLEKCLDKSPSSSAYSLPKFMGGAVLHTQIAAERSISRETCRHGSGRHLGGSEGPQAPPTAGPNSSVMTASTPR